MISSISYLFRVGINFSNWFFYVINFYKNGKYHLEIFYTLKLFNLVDHLGQSKIKVPLLLILAELQSFFLLRCFKLIVLNFQHRFWVAKVVHPQHYNWNMITSCQTLLKDLRYLNQLFTRFSSIAVWFSLIIDKNQAIHESPRRKPDWECLNI